MPYDVIVEIRDNYIRADVTGQRIPGKEVDDALAVWSQLAGISEETGLDHILFVAKMTGTLSTVAAYTISNSLEATGLNKSSRLAFVDLNEESRKENVFGETVVYNRGWTDARIFDNEDEAVAWLLSEDE